MDKCPGPPMTDEEWKRMGELLWPMAPNGGEEADEAAADEPGAGGGEQQVQEMQEAEGAEASDEAAGQEGEP